MVIKFDQFFIYFKHFKFIETQKKNYVFTLTLLVNLYHNVWQHYTHLLHTYHKFAASLVQQMDIHCRDLQKRSQLYIAHILDDEDVQIAYVLIKHQCFFSHKVKHKNPYQLHHTLIHVSLYIKK